MRDTDLRTGVHVHVQILIAQGVYERMLGIKRLTKIPFLEQAELAIRFFLDAPRSPDERELGPGDRVTTRSWSWRTLDLVALDKTAYAALVDFADYHGADFHDTLSAALTDYTQANAQNLMRKVRSPDAYRVPYRR